MGGKLGCHRTVVGFRAVSGGFAFAGFAGKVGFGA
jgi:hypothetical protein